MSLHRPKASVELAKTLMERQATENKISNGFISGIERMKLEEHKLAVEKGDEPPALS